MSRKVDIVEWLRPVFCQGKSRRVTRFLVDLRKLSDALERDEWPLETIFITLSSGRRLNHATKLDQETGNHAMQVEENNQTFLGIATP